MPLKNSCNHFQHQAIAINRFYLCYFMRNRCFGSIINQFETIDSTSLFAEKLLLTETPCEGSVILAGFQMDGRGAGSNTWQSEAGKNLLASTILYPDFLPPDEQFQLNKVVSLAVLFCVKGFLPKANVMIKWPNDIYVDYRKIAGILIRNAITGNKICHSVVGIGLNINQDTFPADLPNPISIKQVSGRFIEIQVVLIQFMELLSVLYHKMEIGVMDFINDQYLKNLLNMNQKAWYQQGDQIFEGRITGVTRFGKLQMEVEDEIKEYDLKEITFLFKNIQSV